MSYPVSYRVSKATESLIDSYVEDVVQCLFGEVLRKSNDVVQLPNNMSHRINDMSRQIEITVSSHRTIKLAESTDVD
jgi:hypothetical protein